jgi:hypothetical protein
MLAVSGKKKNKTLDREKGCRVTCLKAKTCIRQGLVTYRLYIEKQNRISKGVCMQLEINTTRAKCVITCTNTYGGRDGMKEKS